MSDDGIASIVCDKLICVFCGEVFTPPKEDREMLLKAHIRNCEKHPYGQLLEKVSDVKELLYEISRRDCECGLFFKCSSCLAHEAKLKLDE